MVALNKIKEFGRQIGEQFGAERVILFGSYAQGKVTTDSDVDLLVIGPFKGRGVDKSVEIRMKLQPQFPVDILIRTPEKVQQRLKIGDQFIREILEDGMVLYDTNKIHPHPDKNNRDEAATRSN
jgi:predicted nucleotidyltransferase